MQRGSLNAWSLISYSEITVSYPQTRSHTPQVPTAQRPRGLAWRAQLWLQVLSPAGHRRAPYLASLRSSFFIYQIRTLIVPIGEA